MSDAATSPRVLGGRYLLEEQIASGGMASVWRAHDEVLARTVAVKLLHDHLAADEHFRERFRREAVAAAKLTHPNIVGLFDTGRDADRVYLVLEFVDGATIRDVLTYLGRLEVGQAALIAQRVARALSYAHERGLVHRDVKPANILLGADALVKVADFGIAKADADDGALTASGTVMGTAAYVAPEQIRALPLTGAADQYGLGCVLYEMLTGRPPFTGDNAVDTAGLRLRTDPLPTRSLRADVPRALGQVVMRMLAREPQDRYPSCGHAAEALTAFADESLEPTVALLAPHLPTRRRRVVAPAGNGSGPSTDPLPIGTAPDTFLRSEGRWLVPVLALLGLGAILVVGGLLTGVLSTDSITSLLAEEILPSNEPTPTPATPVVATPVLQPVAIADVVSLDPEGDNDAENDRQLLQLIDGALATTWSTETYNSPQFGNLKDGVGVAADLGRERAIDRIVVHVDSPGVRYQLYATTEASPDGIDGATLLAEVEDAQAGEAIFDLDEPVDARWVVLWVTGDLQPDGGSFSASFGELSVEAAVA